MRSPPPLRHIELNEAVSPALPHLARRVAAPLAFATACGGVSELTCAWGSGCSRGALIAKRDGVPCVQAWV